MKKYVELKLEIVRISEDIVMLSGITLPEDTVGIF